MGPTPRAPYFALPPACFPGDSLRASPAEAHKNDLLFPILAGLQTTKFDRKLVLSEFTLCADQIWSQSDTFNNQTA
jgi:hypothetical protein